MEVNTLSLNRKADFALDSIPIQERAKFRHEINKLSSWNPRKRRVHIRPFNGQKNKYIYKFGDYLIFFEYNSEKNQIDIYDVIPETLLRRFK